MITLVVLCILGIYSCDRTQNKKIYSCDPDLNDWATAMQSFNSSISRDSLATLDLDTQYAIFASLPSEDKIRIYQEKVDKVKILQSLTPAQGNFLQSAVDFMQPEYYEDTIYQHAVDSFEDVWRSTAYSNYSWDSVRITFMIETWLTAAEVDTLLAQRPNQPPAPDCECLYDWYCGGISGNCDKIKNCKPVRGCGWFSNHDCKGRCKL